MQAVAPIPAGFSTITPSLVVDDAPAAIAFYERAFGAVEIDRAPGTDGKIMHATIQIGDSRLMLNDEFPDWQIFGPKKFGGSPQSIHLYVADADAMWERAVAAGATPRMPVADTFWGDRYGQLVDPYGHVWSIATHQRDVTDEEIQQAMQAMAEQGGCGAPATE
ncbi:MAG: VOC family protein [Chloroflexi bacterium]|nr:VOC family protein [Chloroflexota bacterium]